MEALENFLRKEFYWLHRHPEVSFEEIETTAHLYNLLVENGVRVLDLPLKTGIVAEVGEGTPVMALRADIDALPIAEQTGLPYQSENAGVMHACGHDFHMASVLGATMLLREQKSLPGTVRLIFQPAEEAPGGAKLIMDTGVLDDVQAIFGLHCSPLLPVGTMGIREGAVTASVDRFLIYFRGKGTHAAHPERGIDPIPVAAAFIQAAQTIVTRNIEPSEAGLVSITHVEAGNTWNVIPDEALVEGTTRCLSAETRALIRRRIHELAEQIAAAYGAEAVTDWYEGPPATDNTQKWTALARRIAHEQNLVVEEAPTSLAGEDFAFYQERLPGCFVLAGTGASAANHNAEFRVDPCALLPTASYLAALVRASFAEYKD